VKQVPLRPDIQIRLRGLLESLASLVRHTALLFLLLSSALGQFRSTQWTVDSGLPQNIIRGIVQSPDGYFRGAKLNGVARLDGVQFTIFRNHNKSICNDGARIDKGPLAIR